MEIPTLLVLAVIAVAIGLIVARYSPTQQQKQQDFKTAGVRNIHGARAVERAQKAIRNRPRIAKVLVRDTMKTSKANDSADAVITFMESKGYELFNSEMSPVGHQFLTFKRLD